MYPVADIIPAAMLGPPQQTAVAEIPAQPKPRMASTRAKTNGKHPPIIAPNINPIHPELIILKFLQESELSENQNNFQHSCPAWAAQKAGRQKVQIFTTRGSLVVIPMLVR